ncbi:MAG: hypothetical protein ACXV3D_04905 [Halobacteriota archaeon]
MSERALLDRDDESKMSALSVTRTLPTGPPAAPPSVNKSIIEPAITVAAFVSPRNRANRAPVALAGYRFALVFLR